ncbi:MAG: sialidase family protein [Actinomycetota bacterium]
MQPRATVIALCIASAAAFNLPPPPAGSTEGRAQSNRAAAHRVGGRRVDLGYRRPPRALEHPIHGFGAIEPTLGFTEEGSLFYTAMRSNTKLDVVRSSDGGETWNDVSPELAPGVRAHTIGLDPYLYVDPQTSRVFTIDLTVACSYVSFSDDEGASWTTNPLGCGRPVNDHQTLFAGPPVTSPTVGYPNVVYYCFNDVITSSCTKSLDGGITFAPTGTPAYVYPDDDPSQSCGGIHGHGVVDSKGKMYLPRQFCGWPYLAISDDEGRTWRRVRVARSRMDSPGSDPSVAVDKQGNIYYAWIAGKDRLPYLSVSRDGGRSWTSPAMIAAPGVTEANLVTIDVGDPGSVAFAYAASTDSSFGCERRDACAGRIDGPPRWHAYMGRTWNALSRRPLLFSATVNDLSDPIVIGGCGPGRCGPLVDFIDVEISPAGDAWGSFVDGVEGRRTNLSRAFVGSLVRGR